MLVISDTSPLRYLVVIGQPELLAALFGEVLAPGEVIAELSKSGTPDVVRTMIEQRPAWLRVRDPAPDMLAAVSAELDPGERSAIALALELHAELLLIDDSAGRREATALQIRITGTVGILRLAAERGLLDVPATVRRDDGVHRVERGAAAGGVPGEGFQ